MPSWAGRAENGGRRRRQEGTARGLMRTRGRECRGAEGGGKALFTVTWLLVVPGRCSLQINPSRASQAPRPLPQPGVPSRGSGVAASPREASARQPGPLPPSPRFLQAMVAAASPTRTQQPLLPTCRAPGRRPLSWSWSSPPVPPPTFSGLVSWEFRWAARSLLRL